MNPNDLMCTFLGDVVSKGRLERIDEIAHPDMVDEANLIFGGPVGRAGLVAHVRGFRRHIQHAEITVHRVVAGADEVMAWWSFTGIHAGPWMDRPPSGKKVSATVFSFFELDKGLIQRYQLWLHADLEPPVIFDTRAPRGSHRKFGNA